MPLGIAYVNSKETINPVIVVINAELTQPERSEKFFDYGKRVVDLEQLIRIAIDCSVKE